MNRCKYRRPGKAVSVLLTTFLFILLLTIIFTKTVTYPFEKNSHAATSLLPTETVSLMALKRLSGGIRIPTVSSQVYEHTDFAPFRQFKNYLPRVYPRIYASLDTLTINEYGLVLKWKGKDASLKPVLFLSHYDVVPVNRQEPENSAKETRIFRPEDKPVSPIHQAQTTWEYPPFSGAVANGRIYGRGTLDMKSMLFAMLEACDTLLAQGFQPQRDIYFAFGPDEEVNGKKGAVAIANYFKKQQISFDAIYDEGGIVASPGLGDIQHPLALVGIGEKGFLTLKIFVRGTGGHSSMPPQESALVNAANIIKRLNDNRMPPRLTPLVQSFLKHTAESMPVVSRMAIANPWLFKPVLLKHLTQSPSTNALVRTTTAITMIKGSQAQNILPDVAEITVNCRILQGDSIGSVVQHVKNLCNGYEVSFDTLFAQEPSAISSVDAPGFEIIRETIARLYPGTIVTPYLTIGSTDAYKYQQLSDHIYRFMPVYLNEYEQHLLHNTNEHISIENYGRMIGYFKGIMSTYT